MYKDPKEWAKIRNRFFIEGASKRQILRETGMHWETVKKILNNPFPLPVQRKRSSKIDVDQLIDSAARTIIACLSSTPIHKNTIDLLGLLIKGIQEKGYDKSAKVSTYVDANQAQQWMLRLLQKDESIDSTLNLLGDIEGLSFLLQKASTATLRDRNRAITVLARLRGITFPQIARFLHISRATAYRHWRKYKERGIDELFNYSKPRTKSSEDQDTRSMFFSVLHSPPSEYGINRTSWKLADLRVVLANRGFPMCKDTIREILKTEGYKWRNAKIVLTSHDPEYREKLERIQCILANLGENDRLFSIDEFGPFAVKMRGGRRLVAPDEHPSVPQFQKSKGWLILTAALELLNNQVTHFYSRKKNTSEMIKLLNLLMKEYESCDNIYLSWDAASWHMSNELQRTVDKFNGYDYKNAYGGPYVQLAPLPASAQFLNVIESVFSGMARAIIHNSNYGSVGEAKTAIDRYFRDRNEYFQAHPKRAGKKIWGRELVKSEFKEGQNCKDPKWLRALS